MPVVCGLHWLPILCIIVLPLTFIISYAIAVALHHVEAGFPYISDTGTQSPESCVFGQLLNIAALLVGATIYVRYKQVKEYNCHSPRLLKVNTAGLVLGLSAAFGISMVGNFQESNVLVVHLVGAVLAFGVGTIYCWLQTFMSYHMVPHMNTRSMCHLRLAICIFTSLAFLLTFVFGAWSLYLHDGNDKRKWKPDDGGFVEHIVSTASEWAMSLFMLTYFVTYTCEFKRITMSTPQIHLLIEHVPLSSEEARERPDEVIT